MQTEENHRLRGLVPLRISGFVDSFHRPEFYIIENNLRKLDLCLSSEECRDICTELVLLEELTTPSMVLSVIYCCLNPSDATGLLAA
jgi:hypothetical protein